MRPARFALSVEPKGSHAPSMPGDVPLPSDPPDSPWSTRSAETVYRNPWIEVSHREVTTPTGSDGIYGLVQFNNHAIGVIPIDDEDHTWLVGQFRYPIGRYTWEIPEGGGPIGTDPEDSARRELREECGLLADNLELILEVALSNSVTNETGYIYIARGLTKTDAEPDHTEDLQLRRVPVDEAIAIGRTVAPAESRLLVAPASSDASLRGHRDKRRSHCRRLPCRIQDHPRCRRGSRCRRCRRHRLHRRSCRDRHLR